MDDDAFQHFAERLEEYARGEDKGWAAHGLLTLGQQVFGAQFEATWGWEVDVQQQRGGPDVIAPTIDVPSLVPAMDQADLDFAIRVLECTALYSGLTTFVLPITVTTSYTSYSANDTCGVWDRPSADLVLAANLRHLNLVKNGRCVFLPTISRHVWGSVSSEGEFRAEAPLRQDPGKARFLSMNPRPLSPATRLPDMIVTYKEIVLPHFPGADIGLLGQIAEAETDAFRRFNLWLGSAFARMSTADQVSELETIFAEMDEQVESVAAAAKDIHSLRTLRDLDLAFFTVSIAVAADAALSGQGILAGLLGGAGFLDVLRKTVERKSHSTNLSGQTFYIPWLLREEAEP